VPTVDAVIVGAGMAGLTCALDLRDAGANVVVLEAGDRPGGRVRTVTFDDGRWVETGGEWIDTAHLNVQALLKRFSLRPVGDAPPWWEREAGWIDDDSNGLRPSREVWLEDGHVRADFATFDHLVTMLARGIPDSARPYEHPDAAAVDARSGADLFDDLGIKGFARFFLTAAIRFEYACEPDQISALMLAQQRAIELSEEHAFGMVRSQRVSGGLSRLAEAMAEELGGDAVRYGQPLMRLDHGRTAIVARTENGTVEADHVVLACAPPPLRAVAFDPPLPDALAAAIASIGLGAVTKTFVRYPQRTWTFPWAISRRFNWRAYDATEDQPGAAGVLDAYIGGDPARELDAAHPEEHDRVDAVRTEIEHCVPSLAGSALGGLSRSWQADPRYGGAFSLWGPGQVTSHWHTFREPHGRIHIAGEHASTVCGYVEGAVESGHRAAAEVLDGR
jgi:monoamine oxidase